uniref:Exosome component 5 n=1 Tax=Sinocyclocheilus grahami TaxID=75366 RepID=A0A672SUX3_SINGR
MRTRMELDQSCSAFREYGSEQSLLSKPDGFRVILVSWLEVKVSKEIYDRATVEVLIQPKMGLPGNVMSAREQCETCQAALLLTLRPRSSVTVILQVIHDDGSLLSCCLNAACMALMDARLPMSHLFCSVTCAISKEGQIIIDPTARRTLLIFAIESVECNVLMSSATGSFSVQELQQCVAISQKASEQIFQFYRDSVKRRYSKIK